MLEAEEECARMLNVLYSKLGIALYVNMRASELMCIAAKEGSGALTALTRARS